MHYNQESYKILLRRALELGFAFVDYFTVDFQSNKKQVLLRHDIDFSPVKALELAKMDAALGIKSTFAILVRSPHYNPFDQRNCRAIEQIHGLGHDIALHYYRPPDNHSLKSLIDSIKEEFGALERFFPFSRKVFVWHNIGPLGKKPELISLEIPGFVNPYGRKFLNGMKYLADSTMRYRPEELIEFLSHSDSSRIHLLLHPCYWVGDRRDMNDFLASFFVDEFIRARGCDFRENGPWLKFFPDGLPQELLDRIRRRLSEEIKLRSESYGKENHG